MWTRAEPRPRKGHALHVRGVLSPYTVVRSGFVIANLRVQDLMQRFGLLIAGCALLAGACSDPGAAGARDLLARRPDGVLAQPGEITPSAERQWDQYGPFDWYDWTDILAGFDPVPYVWSRRRTARLILPAGQPKDRRLGLELWVPDDGGPPASAEVRLNGITLGILDVATVPTLQDLNAPTASWTRGENLLEIEIDRPRKTADGRPVGIALSKIVYGQRKEPLVNPQNRGLVLRPDNAIFYDVEEFVPVDVHLKGTVRGEGLVVLSLSWIDAETGQFAAQEPMRITAPLQDETFERIFPLPRAEGHVIRLGVGFRSELDDEASVAIDELTLVETVPLERPPIILISVDTLSARHLQPYGYERDTSPNLARFAAEGVVFENCYTNATWTLPSFLSLMTGLYAGASGLDPMDRTLGGTSPLLWEMWYLAENRWTMAEMLRSSGYETAGFVDSLWISERFGMQQGFDLYDASAGEIHKTDPAGGIQQVSHAALDWLDDRESASPFFLFMHAFDVHGPYSPGKGWRDRYDDDEFFDAGHTAPANGVENSYGIIPQYIARGEVPVKEAIPGRMSTAIFEAAYDEGIRMTDAALGEFFDELRARDIYDEAVIIVVSDHGETMGHGEYLFGHGVMDSDVLGIPMIIRLPGGKSAGRRVTRSTQIVDLYPTLKEIAGIGGDRSYLHGRSLMPLLDGMDLAPVPTFSEGGIMEQVSVEFDGWRLVREVPGQHSSLGVILTYPKIPKQLVQAAFPELREHGLTPDRQALFRTRADFEAIEGYLRNALAQPIYGLYDLNLDPEARHDLSRTNTAEFNWLHSALVDCLVQRETARANATPPASRVELTPEDLSNLKKLGYIGD